MIAKTICSKCGQPIEYEMEGAEDGSMVDCPSCATPIAIVSTQRNPPPPKPAAVPPSARPAPIPAKKPSRKTCWGIRILSCCFFLAGGLLLLDGLGNSVQTKTILQQGVSFSEIQNGLIIAALGVVMSGLARIAEEVANKEVK